MIELVLVFCLAGDPQKCVEEHPVFEEPLTGRSCPMTAQPAAVRYVELHPGWRLARWRCERNKREERGL